MKPTRNGWRRHRRGQTIILAVAVMFILLILGGVFVTVIGQNLTRVNLTRGMSRAEALALAGIQFVKEQMLHSREGADWRPIPAEPLWRRPRPQSPAEAQARALDPDAPWLGSDPFRPFVRYHTRDGRFLVRVTFEPRFRPLYPDSTFPDYFDPNSMYIRIESVGRPGVVDPTDPTTMRDPAAAGNDPGNIVGEWRKLEAWVPIGLMDQLWWITNRSRRREPARLGLPRALYDEDGRRHFAGGEYQSLYVGGIRANTDLEWIGRNVLCLMPARGDAVRVAGEIRNWVGSPEETAIVNSVVLEDGNALPLVRDVQDDANLVTVATVTHPPSSSPAFNPLVMADGQPLYADDEHLAQSDASPVRSIRDLVPPDLDTPESTTQVSRYLALTRDSGPMAQVTVDGDTRYVNLGLYGYGKGLYFDNYQDIQYPRDRKVVWDEWFQRGPSDVRRTGWNGYVYVPSVRDQGAVHPILELEFRSDGIWATRYDRDVRGHNFGRAAGGTRLFYQLLPGGALQPAGQSMRFAYPENGVIYCEGSVRVRGIVGSPTQPRQVVVISGGTIYIEGNLLPGHPVSFVGLLARDNVCVNPTAFFRFRMGDEVELAAERPSPGQDPTGYHYVIRPGDLIDLLTQNADRVTNVTTDPIRGYLLHVRHSAATQDLASRTEVALFLKNLGNRYDFGRHTPPYPSNGSGTSDLSYRFFFFPPGVPPVSWSHSNYQSVSAGTTRFEQKSFFLPIDSAPGEVVGLRWYVEPQPEAQPYWLGRAALIPFGKPLRIEIHATIYAQEGSWAVIPMPWFNENRDDSRLAFATQGTRAEGTFPNNSADYPFYKEPLNIDLVVQGSITENVPAEVTDRYTWTLRQADTVAGIRPASDRLTGYAPTLRYYYNYNYRRYVRYRLADPTQANTTEFPWPAEGVAYAGPVNPTNPGPIQHSPQAPTLAQLRQGALLRNTYLLTLPLLPGLPAGTVIYEGNPL